METLKHMNSELAQMLHSGVELTMSRYPFPDINLALLFITLLLGLFWLLVACMLAPEDEDRKAAVGKRDEDLKHSRAEESEEKKKEEGARRRFEGGDTDGGKGGKK